MKTEDKIIHAITARMPVYESGEIMDKELHSDLVTIIHDEFKQLSSKVEGSKILVTDWLKDKNPLAKKILKDNWMAGVMQDYAEYFHAQQ